MSNSITYYPTQADALAGTNSIGTSGLIVETKGGFSSWRIASNSTGTADKLVIYNTSDTLDDDGNYNLYPPTGSTYSITYYPTQADALAETNSIGTGSSLVIETIGGFSSWRIVSNSTGTYSQFSVYTVFNVLNDDGNYNVYPYASSTNSITYYTTQADALAGTNSIGTSGLQLSAIIGNVFWKIASNSTGTSSQLDIYVIQYALIDDGNYNVYPAPSLITYYLTQSDALANTNIFDNNPYNYNVAEIPPVVNWLIASNSTGSSSKLVTYTTGDVLNNDGFYYLYPAGQGQAPCFLEGSQILCLVDEKETYLPIEKIRKGTLVKTINHGYKMVHVIGKRDIPNFSDSNRIKDRLYKLTTDKYPTLTSDLYLTGCHSTLVDSLTTEQKDSIKKMLSVVCVTDKKYRLPACIDQNAEPWQSKGTYTVWHFALDSEDPFINFGVYANGGLLVETGSIRYLEGKANMEFV